MSHIHRKYEQHDNTSTAYIVRLDTDKPRALLHMHKKLRMLTAVGGHVELTENNWQAVLREIKEESGYIPSELKLFQPTERIKSLTGVTLEPYPLTMKTQNTTGLRHHWHNDVVYGFTTTKTPSLSVGTKETNDIRWLTQQELSDLADDCIYPDTREIYTYIFDVCLPYWEQVTIQSY